MTQEKRTFLGHEELAAVRRLRDEGPLEEAEAMLMEAEPSPAVLDELRKISSASARAARKRGDWAAVQHFISGYSRYADQMRDACIGMVNAEPPEHTDRDNRLFEEAKQRLSK